jgi:hypothetical protein
VQVEKPKAAACIAEQDKVFAEKPYLYRASFCGHVLGKSDGPPVTPEHVSSRSARPDARDQFIFLNGQH